MSYAGMLDEADAHAVARWLGRQALPNGGFVGFAGAAEGDPGVSACVAAFLRRFGDDHSSGVAMRAEAFTEKHGGHAPLIRRMAAGDLAPLYLAMMGALDPRSLPNASLALLGVEPVERWFLSRFNAALLMAAYSVRLITVQLLDRASVFSRRERARGIYWLSEFQNPAGSWNAWAPVTALNLAALRAAGLEASDDRCRRAGAWLLHEMRGDGTGRYWNAFDTPLWATVFNVHALLAAGVPAEDPMLESARDYILASQCTAAQTPHNRLWGNGPLTGGFAFRPDNCLLPDSDDSAAALGAMAALRERSRDRGARRDLGDAIEACKAWLLGMQNPDGGFSSYVCGLPGKRRGPLFQRPLDINGSSLVSMVKMALRPPPELGDPSTEDVTGRALHGLALCGLRRGSGAVDRALGFLRSQQLSDGSFWGRWLVNYLAATSYVIRGAVAAGEPPGVRWISRALDFLERAQQPSGAWGEDVASYRHPERFKARGASCPAVTGRVLCALIDGGRGHGPAATRGLRWLASQQLSDGSWDGSRHQAAIHPPDTFYLHAAAGTYYPLWALALGASVRTTKAQATSWSGLRQVEEQS